MNHIPQKPVAVLLLAFGIICSRALWAGEHPVPLEKNVDAAKCLECHEDKTKAKNVHTAISMGCTACHEVQTEGETTKIELNQPVDKICFTCHDKTAKETDTLHGPYEKGRCVFCHDPHVSDYPKQLRGEVNGNFCMECHLARKNPPEKVPIFAAHELTRDEFSEIPKIYLEADGKSGHPVDRHPTRGRPNPMKPEEQMGCLTCHVPHSSPAEKLLVVDEKEKRDICSSCHVIVDSAKEDAALKEGRELEAKRLEELKKKNPNAGQPVKRSRRGGEQQ